VAGECGCTGVGLAEWRWSVPLVGPRRRSWVLPRRFGVGWVCVDLFMPLFFVFSVVFVGARGVCGAWGRGWGGGGGGGCALVPLFCGVVGVCGGWGGGVAMWVGGWDHSCVGCVVEGVLDGSSGLVFGCYLGVEAVLRLGFCLLVVLFLLWV